MYGVNKPGIRQQLLDAISAFQEKNGLADSTFGRVCLGDPHVVKRIRDGKNFTVSRAEQVYAFMAGFRTADAQLPDIPPEDADQHQVESWHRGYQLARERIEKGQAA